MPQEEMDKQKAQEEANRSSQERHVPGEPGSGADDKPKTVPLQALQEERSKRKATEDELATLKGKKPELKPDNPNHETPEIPKLEITDEDLLSPKELASKITQHSRKVLDVALRTTDSKMLVNESKKQVDAVIGKYAIYKDDDPLIATSAARELANRLQSDPSKTLEQHAEDVAKQFSKYKVAAANGADGGKQIVTTPAPVPPAGAGSDVSHLNPTPTVCTTAFEASQASLKIMETAAAQKKARGG